MGETISGLAGPSPRPIIGKGKPRHLEPHTYSMAVSSLQTSNNRDGSSTVEHRHRHRHRNHDDDRHRAANSCPPAELFACHSQPQRLILQRLPQARPVGRGPPPHASPTHVDNWPKLGTAAQKKVLLTHTHNVASF